MIFTFFRYSFAIYGVAPKRGVVSCDPVPRVPWAEQPLVTATRDHHHHCEWVCIEWKKRKASVTPSVLTADRTQGRVGRGWLRRLA